MSVTAITGMANCTGCRTRSRWLVLEAFFRQAFQINVDQLLVQ